MTKPWAVYIRVSTDEQATHGVSLDAQRTSCLAYLQAHGLTVGEVIEDAGLSAKNLKRAGMQRLLGMIARAEIAGVIAWKLDRLSRSVRDLWDLIERAEVTRVAVACVMEKIDTSGPFGRFLVTVLAALAQLEREQTAERVTLAQRHIRSKGGFAGGPIPVGLRSVGEKGNKRLELDPEKAPAMARVWPMVLDGASLRDVATYLNGAVRTRNGKPWAANTVSDYLRLEQLVGFLVTRERFDAATAELDRRASPRRRGGRHAGVSIRSSRASRLYLLAGLAHCLHCDAALVGSFSTGRNGPVHYYRCSSNNRRGKAGCHAGMLPAAIAEDAVIRSLRQAVDGDEGQKILDAWNLRAAAARAAAGPLQETRRAKLMERDRAQERVDRLIESLAVGGAAARAVQKALEQHQVELEQATLVIMQLDAQLAASAKAEGDAIAARQIMSQAISVLEGSTPEQQAKDLRTILTRVSMAADVPRIVLDMIIDPPAAWCAQNGENGGPFPTSHAPLRVRVGIPFAPRRKGLRWSGADVGTQALADPLPPPPSEPVPMAWLWSRLEEALGPHPSVQAEP